MGGGQYPPWPYQGSGTVRAKSVVEAADGAPGVVRGIHEDPIVLANDAWYWQALRRYVLYRSQEKRERYQPPAVALFHCVRLLYLPLPIIANFDPRAIILSVVVNGLQFR
jgi:hypothetical protein